MAKRSRMSILKRQREMNNADKAARKRAKRHGIREVAAQIPTATVDLAKLMGPKTPAERDPSPGSRKEGVERKDKIDG